MLSLLRPGRTGTEWDSRPWDYLGERWPTRTVITNGLFEGFLLDGGLILVALATVNALLCWAPALAR